MAKRSRETRAPGERPSAPAELSVVAVEAVEVRVPFRRPLLDPTGEYTHRRTWLLRLRDASGVEATGEAALHPAADDVATESLASLMRRTVDVLVARGDGRHGDSVADELAVELAASGAPGRAALAGLDGALAGLRLAVAAAAHESRNGSPPLPASVPVAASIGFGGPDAGADAAAQAIDLGFETLELRAGYERQTSHLVDRLRAIRTAVGPEPRLRIDAGGAWDLETAAQRIAAAEPFLIEFVEQPLAASDLTGHAVLRERVGVSIALDESVESEGAARAALAEGAADVLVVKPARVGGGAAALRIAELAAARGCGVVLGTFFETGVGIAAALRIAAALSVALPASRGGSGRANAPRAHSLATAGVLRYDLLAAPLAIEDGRMEVPSSIELDEAEIGRYATERVAAR